MKNHNFGLVTLAVAIVIAALVLGHAIRTSLGGRDAYRYEIIRGQANDVVRLDRRTGEISMCIPGTGGSDACGFTLDQTKP